MTNQEDKLYQVALSLAPQIGPVLSKQLINHFKTPQNIFSAPKGKVSKIRGIGPKLTNVIDNKTELLRRAEQIMEQSVKKDIRIHYYQEPSYPQRLLEINDAPIVLYSKGNFDLNYPKTIGIVGTRRATSYGLAITSQLIEEAKEHHPLVISGLAYGIDVRAHQASLQSGLPTVGVLACGLDQMYPTTHRKTAEKMCAHGGLISEYPVETKVDPRHFPARNRIIAALSEAIVVAEAAKKGGALITANIAYSYNKPVFAVPGNLKNTHSEGCNKLIEQMKASIYVDFKGISEALHWDQENNGIAKKQVLKYDHLKKEEQEIVKALEQSEGTVHIDQLSWLSQIPLNQLASLLLSMEFEGIIRSLPGNNYQLK